MPVNPFNPPTKVSKIVLDKNTLLSDLLIRLELNELELSSVLRHGGFYLNQKRIFELPSSFIEGSDIQIYRFVSEPEDIPLNKSSILYEDKNYLAYDKPAWLPTQGTRASVIYSLEHQLKKLTDIKTLMAIHRLDRQTSGIVLFGKNSEATGKMMQKFSSRDVEKKYLAVVSPLPEKKEWDVTGYLARNHKKLPLDVFKLVEKEIKQSKYSHSSFKVLDNKEDTALVEAVPHTGRTHQLRVHLAASGCVIVGDTVYGPFQAAKQFGNPRIQLHASWLNFPVTNAKIEVNAPIPNDWIWK